MYVEVRRAALMTFSKGQTNSGYSLVIERGKNVNEDTDEDCLALKIDEIEDEDCLISATMFNC